MSDDTTREALDFETSEAVCAVLRTYAAAVGDEMREEGPIVYEEEVAIEIAQILIGSGLTIQQVGGATHTPPIECHECGRAIADDLALSSHRVLAHGWGKEDS